METVFGRISVKRWRWSEERKHWLKTTSRRISFHRSEYDNDRRNGTHTHEFGGKTCSRRHVCVVPIVGLTRLLRLKYKQGNMVNMTINYRNIIIFNAINIHFDVNLSVRLSFFRYDSFSWNIQGACSARVYLKPNPNLRSLNLKFF